MVKKKYTVLGGDLRSIKLANILKADDNIVYIYGFKNAGIEIGIEESTDLEMAIRNSEVVIGPIPCSNDNETINSPFCDEKIHITNVFKTMSKNQLFLGGKLSEKLQHLAEVYNVYAIDLLEREEMSVLNAIPSAEGAIQIAMEETPITIHGSDCLILGFGRIGKILAKMLSGLGANVYVEARKYSDLAWIKSYGYKGVYLDHLINYLPKMNIIFNTVPHIILNHKMLSLIDKDCLILDLASKPGGVDFEKAAEIGLKTIWALSLPGKVAPITAARFIKETIYNIISELGV